MSRRRPLPGAALDQGAVARHLLEKLRFPALVLDLEGAVVLGNQPLRALLGGPWPAPPEPSIRALLRTWVSSVLRSASTTPCFVWPLKTREGAAVALTLCGEAIGVGPTAGVLAEVTSWRGREHGDPDADVVFDISREEPDFGRVLGAPQGTELRPGDTCYRRLRGRERPCPACPAQRSLGPGARVRAVACDGRGKSALVSVTAPRQGVARVFVHHLDEELLSQLHQVRLERLCEAAGLSPREREVFRLLMLGRSAKEIATALAISHRTVKYHQGRILERVGADSRLDLMRLLS